MSFRNAIAYFLTIKPRLWLLKKLLPEAKIRPCGSRYVCNPPVYGTDIDFLVYTEKYLGHRLHFLGYKETPWIDYSGREDKKFASWRRGGINLIVTSSLNYAETFDTATYICKKYNLREKLARAFLHEGIRGNVTKQGMSMLPRELCELITSCNGPYGHAILKAYRAKHRLEPFT